MARALMFVGTSSESGKSIMAAAFCRLFKRRGMAVAPFKSQNMALNSGVTPDGREMGRAQIVQAEAAGITPHVDMNPILLKPTSEKGCQVVVHGTVRGNMEASEYYREKKTLWPAAAESYDRLASQYDIIVLEGAGSPVEMNLKDNDIVNMAMADYADAAVVLVADIDRGGVFASIIGTVTLLAPGERRRLIGVIINKFRGDAGLLESGLAIIRDKTGVPVLGVVPYMTGMYVPGEDSVALDNRPRNVVAHDSEICVGVIRLPHIANYTDFDPLQLDGRFSVDYIASSRNLGQYDAIILPGSKNIFFDYHYLETAGLAGALHAYHRRGGRILGVCGGYQMLGEKTSDPFAVEGTQGGIRMLGLLPAESVIDRTKITTPVVRTFRFPDGDSHHVECYEIHMGRTALREGGAAEWLPTDGGKTGENGMMSADGRVLGTYLHGLFDSDALRDGFYTWITGKASDAADITFSYGDFKEKNYDMLADTVARHVDVGEIMKRMGVVP